jgi:hypothetical protein
MFDRYVIMTMEQWHIALPMVHSEVGTMGSLIYYINTKGMLDSQHPMMVGTVLVVRVSGKMATATSWHSLTGQNGVFYRSTAKENEVLTDSQGSWRIYRNTMQHGNGIKLDEHQYVARLEQIYHD